MVYIKRFTYPFTNVTYLLCCDDGENAFVMLALCSIKCFVTTQQVAPQITSLESIGQANPCTVQAMNAGQMYFPVETNSHQFIQCDAAGIARVLTCPGNLVWDQSRTTCMYPPQNGVVNPDLVMTGHGEILYVMLANLSEVAVSIVCGYCRMNVIKGENKRDV